MCNQTYKKWVSLFFLGAFLVLGVVNTHAYSHFLDDDTQNHCDLCDFITSSEELTPSCDAKDYETQDLVVSSLKHIKTVSNYCEPLFCIVNPISIYNKPPPGLQLS